MKQNIYSTVVKGGYDVRSGVYAVGDSKLSMELDEYGEYRYVGESIKSLNLTTLSAMSDDSPDESVVSKGLFEKTPSIKHDNVIGHYLDLYAGYVAEGEYRKNGSSGGFGTWIAVQLLEKGFIDGIVHVKACDDGDGILFKYCVSNTVEEILGRSKSRYYPVELSGSLNEILLEDKKYAITGTPSVIMEVRLLALKNKDIDKRIKYAIGLVTGHHKSAKYSDALAWEQGIKPGDLIKIDYRKKVDGKLSYEYNTEFTGYIDGEIKTFTSQSGKSFVGDWGHGFFKSKVSDFTDDTFNETADVVLGDAWLPQYREDSRGTNIIIVRNPEIAEIIKDGLSKNALHLDNLDAQTICRSQSGLIHHTRDELPYRLHKKDKANLWRPKKRFEASSELPLIRKYVQNIREKISTKSHTKFKEAVERDDWSYFERSMKLYVIQYRIAYTLIRVRSKTPADIIKFIRKKLLS